MKKICLLISVLCPLISGCLTGSVAAKSVNTGLAKVFEAAAKNTNAFRLTFAGWGANILFEQNMGGASVLTTQGESSGVTVLPVTTLRVQPAK